MTTHMACRPFKRETNTSGPWKCARAWCSDVWRHGTHVCILKRTQMHAHTSVDVSSARQTKSDTCRNRKWWMDGIMTEIMTLVAFHEPDAAQDKMLKFTFRHNVIMNFTLLFYLENTQGSVCRHLNHHPTTPQITPSPFSLFYCPQTGQYFNRAWLGVGGPPMHWMM